MKTNKLFLGALALTIGITAIVSCGSDDSAASLPPIGGFNSADEVAAADLVAYWPLNGSGVESKSNTAASQTQNVTWVDGAKGQAANFNLGWLKYPALSGITNLSGSITISCWAKITNTKLVADGVSTISPLVSFSGGSNLNIGNLTLMGNTHGMVSNDSIQMKAEYHFKMPDGTSSFNGDCVNMTKQESWMDNTHTWNANKIGGQWAHVVYVWDATTANTRIYVNGVKISNSAWESRNNGDPMPFDMFEPTMAILGATPSVADGTNTETWNSALKGGLDEVRVYKTLLTQAQIGALYELEKAGR
jgi:hypothetical protein